VQSVPFPAVFSAIAHIATACVAVLAYSIAKRNLIGLNSNQTLQAEVQLFNLEQTLKNGMLRIKRLSEKKSDLWKQASNGELADDLVEGRIAALNDEVGDLMQELAIHANQLAHLMASESVKHFFPTKEWAKDYGKLFREVTDAADSMDVDVAKVKMLLDRWATNKNN